MVRETASEERIHFGAWVRLEDGTGRETQIRIVGTDEFDCNPAYISIDSPLACALLGKGKGEEAVLRLEARTVHYLVTGISYVQEGSAAPGSP